MGIHISDVKSTLLPPSSLFFTFTLFLYFTATMFFSPRLAENDYESLMIVCTKASMSLCVAENKIKTPYYTMWICHLQYIVQFSSFQGIQF